MRVALLISGYLRTLRDNLPSIKQKIIDKFENVDIYVHITKNERFEDVYLNQSNLQDDIEYINSNLNPITLICEENTLFSESKIENNTINSWFKFYKLNQIKKLNEENEGKKYDIVIKLRPDFNLFSEIDFENETDYIVIPKESLIDKDKLINHDDKFICDVFAYGKSELMDKYFSIYENIKSLISKFGPVSETILFHHLVDNNIYYKKIKISYNVILSKCNIFAICGDSGSGKTTLGETLKSYFKNSFMLECDRYHKWERGNSNWENYTHLNPESNFLTKMNQDIFDLKIGNTIYQVDYDHKTGKFTDKEIIDSSDNIIVCGLHSLYTNNENIYDLKIYIDTEENLKNFWKINRDTKLRGYTLEKSLEQIKSRKDDYYKFIYPQRNKSDLIINFYYENLNEKEFDESKISLKIYIKSNYDINYLNEKLKEINLNVVLEGVDDFYILDFKEYKKMNPSSVNNLPMLNNFYDYIMFIIIHLKKLSL